MALFQQKIAAGHNNAGGFALFTALSAGDGVEFPPARVLGSYSPGEKVLRGNLSLSFEGMKSCKLRFHHMTPEQLAYLNTTYCSSGLYYGNVTLSLNLVVLETYASYNGVIFIPTQAELTGAYDPVMNDYSEVEITVLNLVAI